MLPDSVIDFMLIAVVQTIIIGIFFALCVVVPGTIAHLVDYLRKDKNDR